MEFIKIDRPDCSAAFRTSDVSAVLKVEGGVGFNVKGIMIMVPDMTFDEAMSLVERKLH